MEVSRAMTEQPKAADEKGVGSSDLLADIRAMLLELYSAEDAEAWLDAKHPMLDGKTAREVIAAGYGDSVRDMLQAMLDGAYL